MNGKILFVAALVGIGAACSSPPIPPPPPVAPVVDAAAERARVIAELDDWHDAASKADETRYFGHFANQAVFLGTDARERWPVDAFRAYAHPRFATGRAWSFTSVRRDVTIADGGLYAWFDEDLATPNLGAARGSGVLVRESGRWKIAQYNLAITVPNEQFEEVKAAMSGQGPCRGGEGTLHAVVSFHGKLPPAKTPPKLANDDYCHTFPFLPNDVIVTNGRLRDAVVRLAPGSVRGHFKPPPTIAIGVKNCAIEPRTSAAQSEQGLHFFNSDRTAQNVHGSVEGTTLFNFMMPNSGPPFDTRAGAAGILVLQSIYRPQMRGYVLVTDHPFFAETKDDGEVRIEKVPAGRYTLEVWHAVFGWKRTLIDIGDAKTAEATFTFEATDHATPGQGDTN